MQAQRYHDVLQFQEPIETQNEFTNQIEFTWTDVVGWELVFGEVLEGPGRELLASGTKLGEVGARITLPFNEGLSQKWSVLHVNNSNKRYAIAGAVRDASGTHEWFLTCTDIEDGP